MKKKDRILELENKVNELEIELLNKKGWKKISDLPITINDDHINSFVNYSTRDFSHTHEDDLKEFVRSAKELSNKTTITIPKKPQGTKDLEIVLKSGQSYSIENKSGCELTVKFE